MVQITMDELLENNSKNVERNEKGQLLPGSHLNLAGKPRGARHLSTLLLDAIKRVAQDTGNSDDIEIVKALIDKAKNGDTKAIDMVFDRIEGKAPQKIDITSNDETLGSTKEIKELTQKLNDIYRGTGG